MQCWKNWRNFLKKIEFFVQILFQNFKITNQNQFSNLEQIQEKIEILSNENSKTGRIWKVINQKFSSTKRKLDRKYWKIDRFSMKNFQINFRKHWFTDVKPISKNRDKKSFLLKFKDFMMEMKRHWIPKNFELTFPVFFHHNLKEIYHLVRVTDLKSLQFLKSPLFIRFKGWLWKMLVFEFVRSKGYPFTKNPSFLIILIKIRQYPWDFILEKIHDFQRNF